MATEDRESAGGDARLQRQIAMEASPVALLLVDRRGRIRLANREAERIFGYGRDLLVGQGIDLVIPAAAHARHAAQLDGFFQDPHVRPMGTGRHLQAVRSDGTIFPAEIGLSTVELGDETLVLSAVVDLTVQKQAEDRATRLAEELEHANARLARLAATDELTGLKNRRDFDEELRRHVRLLRRMGRPLSVLLIDVDAFKPYNDAYGHPAGDDVLRAVATLLAQGVRGSDVAARIGGDEFAVLLPDADDGHARRAAERIRIAVRGHPWPRRAVTVSLGIATAAFGPELDQAEDQVADRLLAEADRALYASKGRGRDRATHAGDASAPGPAG